MKGNSRTIFALFSALLIAVLLLVAAAGAQDVDEQPALETENQGTEQPALPANDKQAIQTPPSEPGVTLPVSGTSPVDKDVQGIVPIPDTMIIEDHHIVSPLPVRTSDEVIQAPSAPEAWTTITSENFEGAFPQPGWSVFDGDGATNGEYYWDDDSYKPHAGSWSGWPANGGADGYSPSVGYYPNNALSWLVYGPFNLSDAVDAELLFYYWLDTELNFDILGWYASVDGSNYYGQHTSGNSGGWLSYNFDLTNVPTLGDVSGQPAVWIAFVFTSDSTVNGYAGPFLDDIVLQKNTQQGIPNLTPYTPAGWDYPIVPSSVSGTNVVNDLYLDQDTYIDWSIINSGDAIAPGTFYSCLYFDGVEAHCWFTENLDVGWFAWVEDWLLNLTPTAGWHNLELVTDVFNNVIESNEADNSWDADFYWNPPLANLTCNGPAVTFEQGMPLDWAVVVNTGPVYWSTTDDLAACDNGGNLTQGSGEAACADSDTTNPLADPYDTELWSNPFDLIGYDGAYISFAALYNDMAAAGADTFEVWVWNGEMWNNELSWDEDHDEIVTLDLSSYAGLAGVGISFRYQGDSWYWYAQVDDISLSCGSYPDIAVSPPTVTSFQMPDVVNVLPLDITNLGDAPLVWSIEESAVTPCVPADIPWASVAPDTGTTSIGNTTSIDVTFDSTGLVPGVYTGDLCINSNDPDEPQVVVPLTLEVSPALASLTCNGQAVTFEQGMPLDWAVVVNTGSVYWSTTDDLAACDNGGNLTQGSGEAACADSDTTNPLADPYDTELLSNPFDLIGYNGAFLDFAALYADMWTGVADTFEVWIWNGEMWNIELSWDEDHDEIVTLDLSGYMGLAGLQIRFRYQGDGYDWYAQVDDISLYCGSFPDIAVSPPTMTSFQMPDVVNVQPLDITNLGDAPLVWNIEESTVTPCVPADIPWVSVAPDMGTTSSGNTTSIDVTFDSTGLIPGMYNGDLCITNDDPDEPQVVVPLTLEVAPPPANLWIEPPWAEVPISGTVAVDVLLSGVTDMYGVALAIAFDPSKVQVVDDDPGTPGVQITPGTCPVPDFVAQNNVDNGTGLINYDVSSLAPSAPCNGSGVVATITFHGVGTGDSDIVFIDWLLANTAGFPIPTTPTSGSIMVTDAGIFDGFVNCQGRTDHSGVEVCAWAGAAPVACILTDPTGYYELHVPEGTYDLFVDMQLYLDALKPAEFVPAGTTVTMSPVTVLGGDANDDCTVNILDLSFMGARYLLSCGDPGWDLRADINADCTVNIQDIVLGGSNYLNSCPVPW